MPVYYGMKKIISIAVVFLSQFAAAQNSSGQSADTTSEPSLLQHRKWYQTNAFKISAVPALLIGYSITIRDDHGLYSSQDAYDYVQEHHPGFHTTIDNYLTAAPAVMMYSLDWAGVQSRNSWMNQTLILTMSLATNALLTWSTKELTNVERPDGSDDLSYPSSHTSVSFTLAEVLHQEFKEKSVWISVSGYLLASSVGAMRILNNRHWLSDVVAGAGFGIFSAKLTYLLFPAIQKKSCSRNASGL
jgi:hypothetical protein